MSDEVYVVADGDICWAEPANSRHRCLTTRDHYPHSCCCGFEWTNEPASAAGTETTR